MFFGIESEAWKVLLSHGADPKANSKARTPRSWIERACPESTIELLLKEVQSCRLRSWKKSEKNGNSMNMSELVEKHEESAVPTCWKPCKSLCKNVKKLLELQQASACASMRQAEFVPASSADATWPCWPSGLVLMEGDFVHLVRT